MSTRTIWLLLIGAMILSLIIQQMLKSRFNRYSKVGINLSGAEIARKMLADNGIHDVEVTCVPGTLTDHYNPSTKTVNLSEAVYGQRNIAAAAVAAHECGHVIQHAKGYAPLKMRSALVPIVSFASAVGASPRCSPHRDNPCPAVGRYRSVRPDNPVQLHYPAG